MTRIDFLKSLFGVLIVPKCLLEISSGIEQSRTYNWGVNYRLVGFYFDKSGYERKYIYYPDIQSGLYSFQNGKIKKIK